MSNLESFALEEKAVLHLRDGADELMYDKDASGNPDLSKPMRVWLYGPGSKIFAQAKASANNRYTDRLKKKGKSTLSADEQAEETSAFLAACTDSTENIEYGEGLTGKAMWKALYADVKYCHLTAQIDKFLGDTANFTKRSPTL